MTELALMATDTTVLERSTDPGQFVITACERAKAWLAEVLDHGEIEQIAEIKSQAEAIRVYTVQKQLGKDAELAAAEVVRRAERGIGVAIRRGQSEGKINTARGDQRSDQVRNANLISPREFIRNGEEIQDTYAMTDGVTDAQFDGAISEAKDEGNLSRANVIRKVRLRTGPKAASQRYHQFVELAASGHTAEQVAAKLGYASAQTARSAARDWGISIPADKLMSRFRRPESNRVMAGIVQSLDGLDMAVGLIDFDELDPDQAREWATALTAAIRVLNRLNMKIKEMAQ